MQIGKSKYLRMKETAMEILIDARSSCESNFIFNINDNHCNIYAIIWIKFLHLIAGV